MQGFPNKTQILSVLFVVGIFFFDDTAFTFFCEDAYCNVCLLLWFIPFLRKPPNETQHSLDMTKHNIALITWYKILELFWKN